jgi:hypothetical protein
LKRSRATRCMFLAGLVFLLTSACAFTNALTDELARPTELPPITNLITEESPIPTLTLAPPAPTATPTQEVRPFYQPGDRVSFSAQALEDLESYRSVLKLRSTTQVLDQPEEILRLEILEERIRSEDAAHQGISEGKVNGTALSVLSFYQLGDLTFTYGPGTDQSCIGYDASSAHTAVERGLTPHKIINSFVIQELITVNDEIDGIPVQRYSVESIDLSLGTGDVISGEAWIAQEGRYIVRFAGEARGSFTLTGSQSESILNWDYQLNELNILGKIPLPPACQEQLAAAAFPIPENAFNRTIYGGFTSFESPETPLSVARFYRDRLPKDGWVIRSDESFDDFFLIESEKDGRSLQSFNQRR